MQGIRVNQNEIGQTAGIVYQAAEEAVKQGEPLEFSIRHYEDPHINLGRGLEELAEVPSELQKRRPGGGGYVEHDDTFCYGVAIPKSHPKQDLESARNNLGNDLEQILGENISQDVNYNAGDGDIYVGPKGLQALGVGAADIAEDFGNATVVRGCIYPEVPSSGLYQHGVPENNIAPVENLEQVADRLEDGFREEDASDFVSEESRRREEELQEQDGYRPAEPCFSSQTS
jgi:lipoate-protein ligase A